MYGVARAFGQRPSELLGIRGDDWKQWAVDRATWLWGQWVDGKLAERREEDNQPTWTVTDLLGEWGQAERLRPASDLVEIYQRTGGR